MQQKKSSSLLKSEISRALLQNILVCHKLVCFEEQVPFEDASDRLPLSEWTTDRLRITKDTEIQQQITFLVYLRLTTEGSVRIKSSRMSE